jgi:Tfp pilus assembly protein PilF
MSGAPSFQDPLGGIPVPLPVEQVVARARQLLEANDLAAAEGLAQRALAERPKQVEATQILAAVAVKRGDATRAIDILRAGLSGGPSDASLHMNLCRMYRQTGSLEAARIAGEQAVGMGNAAEAHADLADVYLNLGETDRALACFERAIAKTPDLPRAHLGLSHALLKKGEFRAGWAEYEWRYRLAGTRGLLPKFKQPQWNGMALAHSRLFVLCEQGYGDCFQFARYLPLAAARVREVIVGVSAELKPVIERVPGPRSFHSRWEQLPPFDFQITLSSMPFVFGTTIDSIPSRTPYLGADPEKVAAWRGRLAERAQGRATIGLVWHGRPANILNVSRSVPLRALTPVLQMEGILPVSLQVGAGSEELAVHPERERVFDAAPLLADFGETAALISALDHVVTIETAAAHLAGALARPTQIMLPRVADWRWLEHRNDSPWYPTATLVRQERDGDWDGVVTAIVAALRATTS